MVFQRAPKSVTPVSNNESSPAVNVQNIKTVLRAVESDKEVNRHETIYSYLEPYKQQGVDLQAWYQQHAVTSHQDTIKDAFVNNLHHGPATELAESLPLFANAQGRLGEYLNAKVTKTAKQDDQGNTFIDLVIEVDNKWLETEAPVSLQNAPSKMTFLIDTTTAYGDGLQKKIETFRKKFLLAGKKANVKCYKNQHGVLGVERAKVIVAKHAEYIENVGSMLGECITQIAGDKFNINQPEKFNKAYRAYFLDLMTAIGENAYSNIGYLKSLVADPNRTVLIHEYEKMVAFVEAYKKTPVTRKQGA